MKTPLQQLMDYMQQNQYFIGNDLLAKYNDLKMSKAYLVSYSLGTYDTYIKVNHFVTFDKNKADIYVKKFNRILEAYIDYFNDNDIDDESTMYYIYRTLDINYASLEEIEVR